MNQCPACLERVKALGNRTPVGYAHFGYSPSSEMSEHVYVFPEDIPDVAVGEVQAVDVVRLCEMENPIKRDTV